MYKIEYYSAIKNNDSPSLHSSWIELEEIMLSAINQEEQNEYRMIFSWTEVEK